MGLQHQLLLYLHGYIILPSLYFGAEFTKVYALNYGGGITPDETAVFIIKREAKEIETQPESLSGKHHLE